MRASTETDIDLAARVEASALETPPFEHLYLHALFPPGYYARLLARLPATNRYRELRHRQSIQADGRSARRKFYLFPEHVMLLPAEQRVCWLELSPQLR